MFIKIFNFLILSLFLASCAQTSKQEDYLTQKDMLPSCENPFVVLPGNYIIDLAAGSEVILNPDIHNFALFCDASEARQILDNDLREGRIPKNSDWKIYRLQGNMNEISRQCGKNQLCLDKSAKILEWLDN